MFYQEVGQGGSRNIIFYSLHKLDVTAMITITIRGGIIHIPYETACIQGIIPIPTDIRNHYSLPIKFY